MTLEQYCERRLGVQTTWKHRQKAAKRQKVLTIGLAVFSCLCGALVGHWWNSQHGTVTQVTHALERTQFELAKAQFTLEKMAKIADIRTNIEGVILQIFDVYRKQSQLVETAKKNASKHLRDKTQRELEMMWTSAFPPLQDRLSQLERMLSQLENREPRDFDLPDFSVC
jgi:hypothetical protein